MKPHPGSDKPLSKTALKNQRKHEAKKAAKQVFGEMSSSKPRQKLLDLALTPDMLAITFLKM